MIRPALSLKAKALACIAQREHSPLELRRKLLAHAARQAWESAVSASGAEQESPSSCEGQIDELLDWLTAKDLLSTDRFVETRVRARGARFGNLRIRLELAQHGLALEPEAAEALKHSEFTRARAVWERRFGAPAEEAGLRAKQVRFLTARGFSADVVRRVVAAKEEA